MATLVNYPTQSLADALVAQLTTAGNSTSTEVNPWLLMALDRCGPMARAALPSLERQLADASEQQQRFRLVSTIIAVAHDDARSLGHVAANCRDVELPMLLDVLQRLGPAAREAIPGLIERLTGEHREGVANVLAAIDPTGRLAWQVAQRRLGDPQLSEPEREHYLETAKEIRIQFGEGVLETE